MTPAQRLARTLTGRKLAIRSGDAGPTPEFIIPVAYAVTSPDSSEQVLVVLANKLPYCAPVFMGSLEDAVNPDVYISALTVTGAPNMEGEMQLTATAPHPYCRPGTKNEPHPFRVELVPE